MGSAGIDAVRCARVIDGFIGKGKLVEQGVLTTLQLIEIVVSGPVPGAGPGDCAACWTRVDIGVNRVPNPSEEPRLCRDESRSKKACGIGSQEQARPGKGHHLRCKTTQRFTQRQDEQGAKSYMCDLNRGERDFR